MKIEINPVINKDMHDILRKFIKERYQIHINKDVLKTEAPWSEDPHFIKYKYCNIRREHDRTTIYGIKNICRNKKLSFKNKILNIILFRMLNSVRSFEQVDDFPYDFENIDWKEVKNQKFKDNVMFHTAFIMTGIALGVSRKYKIKKADYYHIVKTVYDENKTADEIIKAESPEEVYKICKTLTGTGDFLAYQLYLDFTYCPEFKFGENDFVHVGPGSKKGIDFLFSDKKGLKYNDILIWMKKNENKLFFGDIAPEKLFTDIENKEYTLCCIENILCEYSKYIRSEYKNGAKPKALYKYN